MKNVKHFVPQSVDLLLKWLARVLHLARQVDYSVTMLYFEQNILLERLELPFSIQY